MADEIMANHVEDVASITLVPGHKGVFKVSLDGEVAFDKHEEGRYPEPSEITAKIFEKLD
jgi:predicted Rdx family selenoprotein